MQKLSFLIGLCCFSLLQSCQQEPVPSSNEQQDDFEVISDAVLLFTHPDVRSTALKSFVPDSYLYFLDSIPPLVYRGIDQIPRPWLKVMTEDSISGWIICNEANIQKVGGEAIPEKERFDYLLRAVLGTALYADYQYQSQLSVNLVGEQSFVNALLQTDRFRYDLRKAIEKRLPELIDHPNWVSTLQTNLPALHVQAGANGRFSFYHDYRYWAKAAAYTSGTLDDGLVQLYLDTYPTDSIQYAYTAYQIAESEQLVHSLLGQGKHYKLLAQANHLWMQDSILHTSLWNYKSTLLEDILASECSFWEPDSLARTEIDSILAQDWPILLMADRVALEARREQLKKPELHGLKVNYRSGRYD